jgi:predicted AlkP superfamily pyrophosphatase or phosphodiesterase
MQKRLAMLFRLCLWVAAIPAASQAQPIAFQKEPAAAGATRRPGGIEPLRHVIIVSVDGLMPASYLAPDEHGLKVPALREIVRCGASSAGARSVFPTMTYPAHTSIATGTNPARHGIFTNRAWDPLEKNQDGWRWYTEDIRVPTLWDLARAKGLRTALVYWPVTVGAHATALVPEFWRADGTTEDAKLLRAISTPALLEEVSKRFPDFSKGFLPPRVKDEASTDIAVHLIETLKPNLLMLHILDVDHWQHEKGPFTPEANAAVENADYQLARLIAAARKAGS